jgi:hypothetical protein
MLTSNVTVFAFLVGRIDLLLFADNGRTASAPFFMVIRERHLTRFLSEGALSYRFPAFRNSHTSLTPFPVPRVSVTKTASPSLLKSVSHECSLLVPDSLLTCASNSKLALEASMVRTTFWQCSVIPLKIAPLGALELIRTIFVTPDLCTGLDLMARF